MFSTETQEIANIREELKQREPIFHQAEFCSTREKLEAYAAPDFWEVGASGQVYDRKTILDTVEARFRDNTEPDTHDWKTSDFACHALGPDTYMVTYRLEQGARHSRRLTIWRKVGVNWQVVYHQGTLIG